MNHHHATPAPERRLRVATIGTGLGGISTLHSLGDDPLVRSIDNGEDAVAFDPDIVAVLLSGTRADTDTLALSSHLALRLPQSFRIAIGPQDALLRAVNEGRCEAAVTEHADPVELAALIQRGVSLTRAPAHVDSDAAELMRGRAELEGHLAAYQSQLALAHEQLRETRNEVLQLELQTSIGQLVRGLAHELNNPLTAILGHAQRLRLRADDPTDVRRRAQTLSNEAERCIALVERLRSLANPAREEASPCAIGTIIGLACERLEQRRVPIPPISYRKELPVALASSRALARVFEQALDNAIQAGAKRIECSGELRHGRLLVHLDNDGASPNDDEIRHCLRPFFTSRSKEGHHGLGLCLASSLLREMGGSITLDRRTDLHGARCTITLQSIGVPNESTPSHPLPIIGSATQVLVIDDEPLVAELLTDMLADEGCETITCGSRAEAHEQLQLGVVRAVLCDVKLPDGDGCELLAHALRRWPRLVGHCALITGDADNPQVRQVSKELSVPVVAKPFHIGAVQRLLRQIL
ncbi:MAG: hybrid sensor histidine kinase/response regulator [Planctomycetota bacterium]|jgi:signal transduction histidine kinase|nr:hybrid sensor histidine kinase/response regulator [Planctomycetota bacterium]